jgi:hypothetical protein
VVTDLAGNNNSAVASFSVTYDPLPLASSISTSPMTVNQNPVFIITFNKPVVGFTQQSSGVTLLAQCSNALAVVLLANSTSLFSMVVPLLCVSILVAGVSFKLRAFYLFISFE